MSRYHKILGVPPSASEAEIKRAYRKLVKIYHPDRNPSTAASAMFIKIDEAYDYLTKPQTRARLRKDTRKKYRTYTKPKSKAQTRREKIREEVKRRRENARKARRNRKPNRFDKMSNFKLFLNALLLGALTLLLIFSFFTTFGLFIFTIIESSLIGLMFTSLSGLVFYVILKQVWKRA